MIKSIFPLHDKAKLKNIESIWYKSSYSYKRIQFIPIDKIRNYFGESIAFYFGFFEYYTLWLIPLAVLTFVTWLAPISSFLRFLICAICNLIWSTIFIEVKSIFFKSFLNIYILNNSSSKLRNGKEKVLFIVMNGVFLI